MPFQKKSDFNFSAEGIKSFILARGLEEFTRTLEKEFFAEATIKCNYNTKKFRADLIIELQCNFGLTESLQYYEAGNWGGFSKDSETTVQNPSPFDAAYQNLYDINNGDIDIAELALHFKDSSLVITRIHDQSIPEHLEEIMSKLGEHFVYVTKGFSEIPYEVFLPVFEQIPQSKKAANKTPASYFDHWGLYYDDTVNHSSMVYNLKTKKLFNEDFFLLD